MPRTLGFAAVLFALAGSAGIAGDQPPSRTDKAAQTKGSVMLLLKTTLDDVDVPDPNTEDRRPGPSIVKLQFRNARPLNVGNELLPIGSDRLELTCAGQVRHDSTILRPGTSVCLYARPDSPEVELCDVHRWYLAEDEDCRIRRDRRSLFCTASDDSCPKEESVTEDEPSDRKSYLSSGPTPQEMAEFQAQNLGLTLDDAAGGFLQTGEALAGRAPRAHAMGDINGDGLQDFVVAPAGVSTVEVYLAKRNGPPEPVARLELELDACALEIRDFGAGPAVDVVVTHCPSLETPEGAWTVFLGDGEGQFTRDKLIRPGGARP